MNAFYVHGKILKIGWKLKNKKLSTNGLDTGKYYFCTLFSIHKQQGC